MRFRKKPVEIEAMQFTGDNSTEIIEWVLSNGGTATLHCDTAEDCAHDEHTLSISTLEGVMEAPPGWWIIRGIQGEFYPCKDTVFDDSYDPVDDAIKFMTEPLDFEPYGDTSLQGVVQPDGSTVTAEEQP